MTIKEYCKKKGYSKEYSDYWEKHEYCEICMDYSQPPHHIKTRGSGGRDNHENLIALCRYHHTEVHSSGWQTFIQKYPELADKFDKAIYG